MNHLFLDLSKTPLELILMKHPCRGDAEPSATHPGDGDIKYRQTQKAGREKAQSIPANIPHETTTFLEEMRRFSARRLKPHTGTVNVILSAQRILRTQKPMTDLLRDLP